MSESLISSFLVSDVSESLRSLTKNERCEQIAQVAHQKWANERIACFFSKSLIRSFLGKKRAIRSENWWANSQPWLAMTEYRLWKGTDYDRVTTTAWQSTDYRH